MSNDHSFIEIKKLMSKLSSDEVKVTKKYLVAFDTNATKKYSASLKLFNILLKRPAYDKEKAKKALKKDLTDESFDRLILRLRDKLLNAYILDINYERKGVYSEWSVAMFEVRHKLMQAQSVLGRGIRDSALRLFNKIILKAKKFELYAELVETLYYKQQILSLTKGQKVYTTKYLSDIQFYERCGKAVYRARDFYFKYFKYADFTGLNTNKLELLTEAIAELQQEYTATRSANVGYFMYCLMMEYYLAMEDYNRTHKTGLKRLKLLEKSPAIYMKRRMGHAYSDLADNKLYLFDFKQSLEYALKAQEYYKKNSFDYIIVKEFEFYSHYYNGNLNKAENTLKELFRELKWEEVPFEYSKTQYFQACVMFLNRKFKESARCLQECKEIEKDLEGWNIGIRILSIINQLEIPDLDYADSKIQAMRKHIARIKELNPTRKRERIILKIFEALDRNSYNFTLTYEECKKDFEKLSSDKKGYRWEIKTPELIVFHKWFISHVRKEPYIFLIKSGEAQKVSQK